MVENVAVENERADVAIIMGANGNDIRRAKQVGGEKQRILPLPLKAGINGAAIEFS